MITYSIEKRGPQSHKNVHILDDFPLFLGSATGTMKKGRIFQSDVVGSTNNGQMLTNTNCFRAIKQL